MTSLRLRSLPLLALALLASALGATATRAQAPDVLQATVPELQAAMERGQVTAVQLVDAYLARIRAYDRQGPALNAIVRLNPRAREEAALLDAERARQGPRGPLHGIPVLLKDNFDFVGLPTTGGSVALAGMLPPDDAFQVRRLREAGAIVIAKTNLHELAAGITTISSLGGQTRNPYDPARNPGGSSGGTGAAVAAGFGAIGWGTDTCGSIRIPASVNNLFGLRPTKGLSSIDGVLPLAHSQDVAGPLARSATDLAIALDATVGRDPADPATRLLEGRPLPRFAAALDTAALRGARIGVLAAHFGDGPEEREVTRVIRAALDSMRARGAEVVEVDVPGLDSLLQNSSVIEYEFKWDLMDYLAQTPGAPVQSLGEILERGLLHRELVERFERRNRVQTRDGEEYRAALARQKAVREAVLRAMDQQGVDALAYPTLRRPVAIVGEPALGGNCQLSAATGLPALSLPVGFTEAGLPVGMDLLGRALDDARLVGMGFAWEQAARPRRAPATTPPLVDGRAPEPTVLEVAAMGGPGEEARAALTLRPTTGEMVFRVRVLGVPAEEAHAVTLHQGAPGEDGPVLHRLLGPGETEGSGTLRLSASEWEALGEGRLFLRFFTRDRPTGAGRVQLTPPR